MSDAYPMVVVLGPTASGKSALGVRLAQELGGEVVACDSTQVYRYFDIGTGKLSASEQGGVPHHLSDLLEPEEVFTAGDYQRRARAVLAEVRGRGRLPVVTAGTGLYLRALLEGLSALPARSAALRARFEERVEERGSNYLHRLLARVDPESARAIGARDTPKLVRALEVYFSAPGGSASGGQVRRRRTRTELFVAGREKLEGYAVTKIGLLPPRAALYARIEERVERMLAAGWLEEVRGLAGRFSPYAQASGDRPASAEAAAGRPASAKATAGRPAAAKLFGFLGYRQLAAHLRGELSLPEAIKQTKHETRQFAKRQITWFRKEPGVKWFMGFGDDPGVAAAVAEYLEGLKPRMNTDKHG
ncbi:MAG: tRNA (adenosine(37)-N6)-dimethylallyltransferase MiaA [Terriglobia bacterium]